MERLAQRQCIPCQGGTPSLRGEALRSFISQLDDGWLLIEEHHIEKEYHFKDFSSALSFTNRVGALAENQGHHPDIYLAWGKVKLSLWTHKIDGLSASDFIFAAKVDQQIEDEHADHREQA
ncbi:4a-hydroxytetrahydrobiopterin dehydratase [Deltaproteobacteria bacterium TL4]